MSQPQVHQIFSTAGISPCEVVTEFDTKTRQAIDGRAEKNAGNPYMSDTTFFKMFGVERVRAIDHSDFEGADIVFDLTKDLPEQHKNSADFIYDGSVMDNVFDPASAMHNVIRLLRPGGRYLGINIGTTKWLPAYVAFNPYWFFDFFVANGFRDVKIYVLDYRNYNHSATWVDAAVYLLNPEANHREIHNYPVGDGMTSFIILAEKDLDSTSDERTSQGCYRLDDEWRIFDANITRILRSKRPVIQFRKQADVPRGAQGFTYVGNIDSFGLESRNPNEIYPDLEQGEINLGWPFAGYDWGDVDAHNNPSWRWIDDFKNESVILLKLAPNQAYTIEAKIHTCRDSDCINTLRGLCDGAPIAEQQIKSSYGQHTLVMHIPESVMKERTSPIRLGFTSKGTCGSPEGRNVALSVVRIYPKNKIALVPTPVIQNLPLQSTLSWQQKVADISGWNLLEEVKQRAINRIRGKIGF